jgi:hypothetical protein
MVWHLTVESSVEYVPHYLLPMLSSAPMVSRAFTAKNLLSSPNFGRNVDPARNESLLRQVLWEDYVNVKIKYLNGCANVYLIPQPLFHRPLVLVSGDDVGNPAAPLTDVHET